MTGPEARQAEALVSLVREVFGTGLVGTYLFGSATLGGLKPYSDLDVLGVTTRSATDAERRRRKYAARERCSSRAARSWLLHGSK